MDTPYAFVVRLEAKEEKAADVADHLWIFDTFGSEEARQAHINGEIAAALVAHADELLAAPPEILPADVLAAK